jgi:hypothetical protein
MSRVIEVIRRGQRGLDGAPGATTVEDDSGNRIINGAFQVWQRGTSQTVAGYGSADRWRLNLVGGATTFSRQAVPLGTAFGPNQPEFHARLLVSGQSLASHVSAIEQRVENVRSYADSTITVLGWARRSSGSGNMAVAGLQHFGTGGSPSSNIAVPGAIVTLTGNWEPFAVTLAVPSISSRVLGTDGNDYFAIEFFASAGADFTRAAGLGVQAIGVDLACLHVRRGSLLAAEANNFVAPAVWSTFAACQRYYETGAGLLQSAVSGTTAGFTQFSVRKRAVPQMGSVNGSSAGFTGLVNQASGTTVDSAAWNGSATSVGGFLFFTWTASAEL